VKCEAIRGTVLHVFCIRSSLFPEPCSLSHATTDSLEFTADLPDARIEYRLVGHGVNTIVPGPVFTVNGLTSGTCYRFTLLPVPGGYYRAIPSVPPIECAGCTKSRMLRFVLSLDLQI